MSNALSTGNLKDIQNLSTELETAKPGVEKGLFKTRGYRSEVNQHIQKEYEDIWG